MNRKQINESEIEKILEMFDVNESLPTNPYFYTRIQQKIDEKSQKSFSLSGILKPAFFTLLVILNLTTAIWYTSTSNLSESTETSVELADVLKSDFNVEYDLTKSLILE